MTTPERVNGPASTGDASDGEVWLADDDTFARIVTHSPLPVLLDFQADWCPPCRLMRPVLRQLAADLAGRLRVVEVDVDASPRTAQTYGVLAMPTMCVIRDGETVARMVGARTRRRLLDELAPHLAPHVTPPPHLAPHLAPAAGPVAPAVG